VVQGRPARAGSSQRADSGPAPPAVGASRQAAAGGSSRATGAGPMTAIADSDRCRGRPSRRRASRFGGRVPPDGAREFFRMLHRRRSAAPRAGRVAAASVRAIGRAGVGPAARGAIEVRVRAVRVRADLVPADRARADRVPADLAIGGREAAPAAATGVLRAVDRLPTPGPRQAATGAIARAPHEARAGARAEPAADGGGGW
jgi:hypothetical protein